MCFCFWLFTFAAASLLPFPAHVVTFEIPTGFRASSNKHRLMTGPVCTPASRYVCIENSFRGPRANISLSLRTREEGEDKWGAPSTSPWLGNWQERLGISKENIVLGIACMLQIKGFQKPGRSTVAPRSRFPTGLGQPLASPLQQSGTPRSPH